MLNEKYGYIYITTNLINGKIYIGQHIISNYIHNKRYGDRNSSKRPEVRAKISKALIGRHYKKSEKCKFNHKIASYKRYQRLEERKKAREIYYRNGMDKISKGRIWITNGIVDKMIYPKDLEKYISLGYKKGRIIRKNKLYLQNR